MSPNKTLNKLKLYNMIRQHTQIDKNVCAGREVLLGLTCSKRVLGLGLFG